MSDLFPLVLAAHMVGDFVVQTEAQALGKTTSWRAMLGHVATYHLVLAALILPLWHDPYAFAFLAISAGTHALIDRRWPVYRIRGAVNREADPTQPFWLVLAVDQALHLAVLGVALVYLGRAAA